MYVIIIFNQGPPFALRGNNLNYISPYWKVGGRGLLAEGGAVRQKMEEERKRENIIDCRREDDPVIP